VHAGFVYRTLKAKKRRIIRMPETKWHHQAHSFWHFNNKLNYSQESSRKHTCGVWRRDFSAVCHVP